MLRLLLEHQARLNCDRHNLYWFENIRKTLEIELIRHRCEHGRRGWQSWFEFDEIGCEMMNLIGQSFTKINGRRRNWIGDVQV